MFDRVSPLRRPADRNETTRVIERVVNEMDSVFALVEPDDLSLRRNESVVSYLDPTPPLDDIDKFCLVAVIVEVVLGKSLVGLEDGDVQVERVDTEFR